MSSMLASLRAALPGAMPRACFISHGTEDTEGLSSLHAALPWYVEPRIFPNIDETPDMTVSTQLIDAILACRGLVYIASRKSTERPFVSFERDYGARSGRDVYKFDPATASFSRESRRPLELKVFPWYARADREKVQAITAHMVGRHFSVWPEETFKPDQWQEPLNKGIDQTLAEGGRFVAFVSNASLASQKAKWELERAVQLRPDRILPVLLEPIDASRMPLVFGELDDLMTLHGAGPHSLDWRMVDRLIVEVYHLARTAPDGLII